MTTIREFIADFREEADDDGMKPFWADRSIVRWLAEAETEAAVRKKLLFDDASAGMTPIAIVRDQTSYALDPRFFLITGAKVYDATNLRYLDPITVVSRSAIDVLRPHWRDEQRWTPRFAIHEDGRLTLPGRPDRAYTLRIQGYRVPMYPLDKDLPDGFMGATGWEREPEIHPLHHRFLLHWVLHRAYGIQDADSFDANRSAVELAKFERYFGPRPDADLYKDAEADQPHANTAYW